MSGPISALVLEFTTEDGQVQTHVATRPCVVGRAEGAGVLQVPDGEFVGIPDSYLSRPHCVFAPTPEGWVVEDAGSTNGTRLLLTGGLPTGVPLRSLTRVVAGMQFRIGHTIVRAVPA